MNIEKVSLEELLEYLGDVIPVKPEGAFGPFSGREILAEVRRRLTLAEERFSENLKLKLKDSPA